MTNQYFVLSLRVAKRRGNLEVIFAIPRETKQALKVRGGKSISLKHLIIKNLKENYKRTFDITIKSMGSELW